MATLIVIAAWLTLGLGFSYLFGRIAREMNR